MKTCEIRSGEIHKAILLKLDMADGVMEKILELNKKYNQIVEESEEVSRNVVWKIKEIEWDAYSATAKRIRLILKNYPDLSGSLVKTIQESLLLSIVCYIIYNTTSKKNERTFTSSTKINSTPSVK